MKCIRAEGASPLVELQKVLFLQRGEEIHPTERDRRSHKGNEEERMRETWRCSGNRGGNREREREQRTRGETGQKVKKKKVRTRDYVRK